MRARLPRERFGAIDVGAADLSALDDTFAREPIHDGHDRGVGARATRGETIANFAHRSFAHRPERIHAIELERREIENRAARRMSFCNGVSHSWPSLVSDQTFLVAASLNGSKIRDCILPKYFAPSKQRAAKRRIALGPLVVARQRIERRSHGRHFRIEIVDEIECNGFARLRQRGRTEFVRAVVAQNQMLDQNGERRRKSGNRLDSVAHHALRQS